MRQTSLKSGVVFHLLVMRNTTLDFRLALNIRVEVVEACRGQCTKKQSQLIYQVAFYKTLSGCMNAHVS